MLVQVYLDDIIFGSTDQKMVAEFLDVMQKRFKISSLGAINFFLGLQVDQTEKGIFLHQSKYVADILSRFKMEDERIAKNPLSVNHGITPENTGPKVNPTLYRAIIGSLMYLTASRPDIMFATYLCARYQAQPNVNHMLAAKKIMRYLKGTPSLGLWYPRKDGFNLMAFSDSDYGGCKRDFKSTSGGCQFLGSRLISWQYKKQTSVAQSTCEAKYIAAASYMSGTPVSSVPTVRAIGSGSGQTRAEKKTKPRRVTKSQSKKAAEHNNELQVGPNDCKLE
ncbi:uncharacterized mitochondrial protein AtMg00810-like [Rutidosis leptorrhynchoides]|uniref:uncharacterized mitochondrial protein AtMg00810-like n=1 Tax=Rutidosis leptorrhynchoides TaxID=125765 RepID=UPI003A993D9C